MATLLQTTFDASRDASGRAGAQENRSVLARRLPRPFAALHERQPKLATAALIALVGAAVTLAAMPFDARTVNGIDVWIKPTKFFISLAVYYATLAWAFGFLPRESQRTRAGRFVVLAPLAVGFYEMSWLVLAAANGVPSHFNYDSPFWLAAFRLAGVGAVVLIAAILVQGIMIARQRAVPIAPAMRFGLVAGAVIAFGATLITAGYLGASGGHWVGGVATDAGGLPLLGWSRTGGDLRVAHFFALHAQQALPALGALAVALGRPNARAALIVAAAGYVGLVAFTFVQALHGVPFLG
ncbi:MAG TPA: hypothetical protein VF339_12195 [Gammaproteobacteria bacterium]